MLWRRCPHTRLTPICMGATLKMWKAKQALYDATKCNTPCRDNNDKYHGIQHGLKILNQMLIYQPHICGPRMMQNHGQPKHGLTWVYFQLMVEHLHMDI